MSSLRWVLLGLGVLLLAGIYLWGRGLLRRPMSSVTGRRSRIEPSLLDREPEAEDPQDSLDESPDAGFAADPALSAGDETESMPEVVDRGNEPVRGETEAPPLPDTDRIVTVRLGPTEPPLNGQDVVLALRAAGLRHGRYGIFHCVDDSGSDEPLFSVANLTEPGSFDLNHIAETSIPGVSFFMILPGVGDPVERFDRMVDTARALAREWNTDLHDERGSSWSIQRERYVREEIIEYRHQLYRV